MKIAVISPHTDDAIFSLGSFIASQWGDVTIISPFAGIPGAHFDGGIGYKKHTKLRKEHYEACQAIGARFINGDFLDDVYPGFNDQSELLWWLQQQVKGFDEIYIPLGIHHPDHIVIRNLFVGNMKFTGFYEELPYRVLYPELAIEMRVKHCMPNPETIVCSHKKKKEEAVKKYVSQISDELLKQLFVEERIWL